MLPTKIILTTVSAENNATDLRHALILVDERFAETRDAAAKSFALFEKGGPSTLGFQAWGYVVMGAFYCLTDLVDEADEFGGGVITDAETIKMIDGLIEGRLARGGGFSAANMGVVEIEFTRQEFRVSGIEKHSEVEVSSRRMPLSLLEPATVQARL